MKRTTINFLWMLLAAMVAFTACKDDDDDGPDPILVEDGLYIVGEATPWTEATTNAAFVVGINERTSATRSGMYEKYVTLEANKDFNILEVAGSSQINYGADAMQTKNLTDVGEHPQTTISYGTYKNSGTFSVETSGLYHVIFDKELGKVFIVPVNYWGILGGASDYGWSDDDTHMTPGTFNKETMSFSKSSVILRTGKDFKFRYDGGWKIGMESFDKDLDSVRVNTNFGGTSLSDLIPGGTNITLSQADGLDGTYTVSMTWSATTGGYGFTASLTDFAEVEPLPEYGDMYLVGDATAYGWDDPGTHADAIMHQCANSQDGLYWKILYIETGKGFKISAANLGDPNIGYSQVTEFDADGVTVSDASGNMSVATSGMYVVALDLRAEDSVKVSVKTAEVYGIGGCFGDNSWTGTTAFTYSEATKNFTSPAITAAGNVRMYAKVPWNTDWWAAEFNIYDSKIVYRNNGGDQDAVAVTANQVVTLHFDDNTGSIQ